MHFPKNKMQNTPSQNIKYTFPNANSANTKYTFPNTKYHDVDDDKNGCSA